MRWGVLTVGLVGVISGVEAGIEIDPMKDHFPEKQASQLDKHFLHTRELSVGGVWYYKNTRADSLFQILYNKVAEKTKNMINLVAVDCDKGANAKACKAAGVETTPHVMIYPPMPMSPYKYSGDTTDQTKLENALYKAIPSHKVTNIKTMEEYKKFTSSNPTKPKCILYHNKKKVPPIFKGLSVELVYTRTIEFAFVGEEGQSVINESGAGKKKLPAVVMISKGKKEWFKGKETNYQSLHEWISPYSESGMGDTVKGGEAATEMEMEEPEYERIRELKDKNQKDLCFGQKSICGVLLSEGKPSDKYIDMLVNFEAKYTTTSDRAVKFNWMWLDLTIEAEFKKTIEDMEPKLADKEGRDAETLKYPTMIFVKPPKKKREEKQLTYIKTENGSTIDENLVGDIVDRISGGASYARADLPKFVNRKKLAEKAKTKTEL